jgi:hypothetical protein
MKGHPFDAFEPCARNGEAKCKACRTPIQKYSERIGIQQWDHYHSCWKPGYYKSKLLAVRKTFDSGVESSRMQAQTGKKTTLILLVVQRRNFGRNDIVTWI